MQAKKPKKYNHNMNNINKWRIPVKIVDSAELNKKKYNNLRKKWKNVLC